MDGKMEVVIVTRHTALVTYLVGMDIFLAAIGGKEVQVRIAGDTPVISHVVTPAQIAGKVVVGVLPLHLAALCSAVVEVELDLPPELRGKELDLPQIQKYARGLRAYRVGRTLAKWFSRPT